MTDAPDVSAFITTSACVPDGCFARAQAIAEPSGDHFGISES
ncbi:MAG: hypothetical protein ACXVRZ_01660 [Gaiellaceae bacterium]